ncbi:DsbA family protein [Candidatus Parcubacteria bacterium]|nr:DsbA family protein [Candidatus Parcubacteria bacterium]
MDQNITPNNAVPNNMTPPPTSTPPPMPPASKPMWKSGFKPNKNQIMIAVAVLGILVAGTLAYSNLGSSNPLSFLNLGSFQSTDTIAKNSIAYLNSNVLQKGQTAELVSASEVSGVVKIHIKIAGTEYDSYATRDGKLLFPEAFTVSGSAGTITQPTATATPANVAKVDKTMLEAYVVSDCPFGLQMQRAIAEAVKAVPTLAQSIKVRYIGSSTGNTVSSMHDSQPYDVAKKTGGQEAAENLRQICIREEQPTKFWTYVSTYMKKSTGQLPNTMPTGDTQGALAAAGIDVAKVNSCMSDTARGLTYAKADFALNTKYNISGSPTLILNGALINETDFGGRSANAMGKIICSSSITAPAFCKDAQLSTDAAATSFSVTYAAAGGTGATANCAPANS